MDSQDKEFSAKLLSIFKVEAKEHLDAISKGLLALEESHAEKQDTELVETIFREAHSLKGAARAVNMENIQAVCQELENVLAAWKKDGIAPSAAVFTVLYRILDSIQSEINDSGDRPPSHFMELIEQLKNARDDISPPPNLQSERPASTPPAAIVQKQQTSSPPPKPPVTEKTHTDEKKEQEHPFLTETIRISVNKLDELFHRIEELLNIKINSQQLSFELQNILELFQEYKKNNFTNSQSETFKALFEKLNKLAAKVSQEQHYTASMVDALLDSTKQARMQPFSAMLEAFPRMVRDLAKSLGKEAHLEIINGDTEVDRRILEELKDPLTHLIRNSIDHGIETPEMREKNNKPPFGTIKISLAKVGGSVVEILVSDDGKGIDPEKIRAAALKQGVISQQELAGMQDKEVVNLIFKSGISTSPIITDLSGRGLGVGIVQEKVEKLGGSVVVETVPGSGTTFKLTLPLTLATFRGIQIMVGKNDFIIPITNVIKAQRVERNAIRIIEGRLSIQWRDKYVPFSYLADILNIPSNSKESPYVPTLIMKAGDSVAAIGVTDIISENEVFAKNLGSQLKRVKYIAAATVLEGGKVIPILDTYDIVKSSFSITAKAEKPQNALQTHQRKKKILVVEDSVTTRVLLKNILDSRGYDVKVATDGQEGLTQVQSGEPFDLILSDVEMPRLTGFQLLEKIRAQEKFKDLPFILCTTRGSKEDLMYGIELGANAYIDKSNFTQSSLLDIIEKLL